MKELDIQLKSLQHKLQLLLKQNQHLVKQHTALQTEKEKLQVALKEKTDILQQLHQQIDILKLTSNALNDSEKKQLEKRIDTYLTEIEKCLTLLNA